MKAFKDIAVIIPAYKPCEKLIEFTKKLFSLGFVNVVIVDDGCDDIYKNIFDKLRETGAVVIEHEVNKGKGEAGWRVTINTAEGGRTGREGDSLMRCRCDDRRYA